MEKGVVRRMNKEGFNILYNALPEEERKRIVVYNNGFPYSLNVIKQEVDAGTELGIFLLEDIDKYLEA